MINYNEGLSRTITCDLYCICIVFNYDSIHIDVFDFEGLQLFSFLVWWMMSFAEYKVVHC